MAPPLFYYERVGSTMDLIHELAERGAEPGTVVVAGEQLEGRGSRGRSWYSPPGGLWLSALYRPPSLGGIEVISLRVGLALARVLASFVPTPVRLKWPNDLMLGERKLGGILCEARWQGEGLAWVAVGVGLNVRNPIAPELRDSALALMEERGNIRTEDVLDPMVAALRVIDLQAERLSTAELHHFDTLNWLTGREIREPLAGTVTGLGEDGTLRVCTVEGSQVFLRNGSIELATASYPG
jgi:BirA family biotin operon repressor/biotin-[acetyl-CoA-carboxylase] ligase